MEKMENLKKFEKNLNFFEKERLHLRVASLTDRTLFLFCSTSMTEQSWNASAFQHHLLASTVAPCLGVKLSLSLRFNCVQLV